VAERFGQCGAAAADGAPAGLRGAMSVIDSGMTSSRIAEKITIVSRQP
jgi:hypothetical protein